MSSADSEMKLRRASHAIVFESFYEFGSLFAVSMAE